MAKLLFLATTLWLLLFALRVVTIGGLDPTFYEEGSERLKPLREYLAATLDQNLPYPQSAILSGIVLGTQKNLPFSLKTDLKTTSTIHIVVVSGQNLTILAGFLMSLATFLGRKKTIILTVFVILLYSLLTGLGIPVIRAAIMASLAYTAQLFGKEKQGAWVLFLTGAVMLLYQPNWLLSISFQLSFLATFGVVVVAPIMLNFLKIVPKIIREDLAVTLSAQAMVLPIIAYNFNQISLIGILVNTLILWSIPIVMIGGFISLGLGLVWNFLGQIAGLIPTILLTYFINIVKFFADIPWASINIGKTGWVLWLGYYLILGALLWVMKERSRGETKSLEKYKL